MARHRGLLIEDELSNRLTVTQYLDIFGIDCVAVASVEEALPLIDAGDFCFLLCDLGIFPTKAATKPDIALGYVVIEYARARYPRRNDDVHLVPILVMSAHAEFDVLRETMHLKADDFIKKPPTNLKDMVHRALRLSGREDHARCAEITERARREGSVPPAAAIAPATVTAGDLRGMENHLTITGKTVKNRTEVILNGRVAGLSHGMFSTLLQLVEAEARGAECLKKDALGARSGEGVRAMSEMQRLLEPYLVPGTCIYENVRGRGYRLGESVVVDGVDVAALGKHEEKRIASLAASIGKIRSKRT